MQRARRKSIANSLTEDWATAEKEMNVNTYILTEMERDLSMKRLWKKERSLVGFILN